ncbi:Glutamate receptor 2.1 [Spatholobus suberectus]|nr:Glutamate receptor 2.1 [Spatholobus suberectus]
MQLYIDLANNKQKQVVIGTKLDAATLFHLIDENSKDVPIISLTSTTSPEITSIPLPHFIQMGHDVTLHMHCVASIIAQFNWRKVTAIYEHNNLFASHSEILTRLSYSLRLVNAEIDHHVVFPSLISLSNPIENIEQELIRLNNKSNKVFFLIQSSLEFATLLFEKAKKMRMMGKGSVWIITDDIATHLDSLDSSVTFNMHARCSGVQNQLHGNESNIQTFQIHHIGHWGLVSLVGHEVVNTTTSAGSARVLLSSVDWPGGLKTIPKGWVYNSTEGRPLKIGVPAIDPCPQFVNISHDKRLINETQFTGFSINVFESVVKRLPYHLPFVFVPFYGSYDQIVDQVNNKDFDATIGNIQVVEHRYAFAEFSHPHVESGIAMVVKPENIRVFDSIHDFPRAFENKEIMASFTIAPHANVFQATYCNKGYIKARPTLKLGGLGFIPPQQAAVVVGPNPLKDTTNKGGRSRSTMVLGLDSLKAKVNDSGC